MSIKPRVQYKTTKKKYSIAGTSVTLIYFIQKMASGPPLSRNRFARQGDQNLTLDDNSCYFDTSLQALASLPSVPRAFELLKTNYESRPERGQKEKACKDFIISIADKIIEISRQSGKTDSTACRKFLKGAIQNWSPSLAGDIKSDGGGSTQHDVGEFLILYLFDTIIDQCGDGSIMTSGRQSRQVEAIGQTDDNFRADLNNAIKTQLDYFKDGILSKLFYFVLSKRYHGVITEDRTKVDQGGARDPGPFDYRRLESFATLTMPFTEKKKGTTTVFELMKKNFTAVESMGEREKISESITYETAFQSEKFGSLPQILCMTLNRRTVQPSGRIVKTKSPVKIEWETDLNFLPFVEKVCQEKYRGKSTYRLYAVTFHSGSFESGHYTCACRTKKGWKYFDNKKETRSVSYSSDINFMEQNSTAFFYEKVDDSGDYALQEQYEPADAKPARSIPQAQAALRHPESVEEILYQLDKPDGENILEQTIYEDLSKTKKTRDWIWYIYPQSEETAPKSTNSETKTEDEIQNLIFTNENYQKLFALVNAQPDEWFPKIDMGRIESFRERNRELIAQMEQPQEQKIRRGFLDMAGEQGQSLFTEDVDLGEQQRILSDFQRKKRKKGREERAGAAEKRKTPSNPRSTFSIGRNTGLATPSAPRQNLALQPVSRSLPPFALPLKPTRVADKQKPATEKIEKSGSLSKLESLLKFKQQEKTFSVYIKSLRNFFAKNPKFTSAEKQKARRRIEANFAQNKNFSRDSGKQKHLRQVLDAIFK